MEGINSDLLHISNLKTYIFMKKSLLFTAAFAMMATSAFAQENLILNGDITESAPDGEQQCPVDWKIGGAGVWNGRVTVGEFTGDEENDPQGVIGDLTNFVKVALYDWNSWGSTTCSQVVETTLDTSFEFSYIYCPVVTQVRKVNDAVNPVKLWVSITECDSQGNVEEGIEPIYTNQIDWADGDEWIEGEWAAVKETLDIDGNSIDYLLLQVGAYGQSGNDSQGGAGQNTVNISASGFSLVAGGGAGVNLVENAAKVISTRYYGIDGVEILNPAEGTFVIEKAVLDNGKVKTSKKVF